MSIKYDNYLKEHITNVQKGFQWLKEYLPNLVSPPFNNSEYVIDQIPDHDLSKFNDEEYRAYDEYFYGNKKDVNKTIKDFNYAWLHHIHHNPHHWQYWVLVMDDDGKPHPLDMPHKYMIEMICDWWAFSWSKGNLYEIFDWYKNHKSKIIISNNTKDFIENVLNQIHKKLDELEK